MTAPKTLRHQVSVDQYNTQSGIIDDMNVDDEDIAVPGSEVSA